MDNDKQLLKILNTLIDFKSEYAKFVENLRKKYYKKLKNDIEKIAHDAVENYYKYPAKSYRNKRKYSLYKAYKITTDDNRKSVTIKFDGSYLEPYHPELGDYIYEWMFGGEDDGETDNEFEHSGGWHGGAVKGEYHPEIGTPWWRKPVKNNTPPPPMIFIKGDYWLKRAKQDSESPYEVIINGMDDSIMILSEMAQKEHDDFFYTRYNRVMNEIMKL